MKLPISRSPIWIVKYMGAAGWPAPSIRAESGPECTRLPIGRSTISGMYSPTRVRPHRFPPDAAAPTVPPAAFFPNAFFSSAAIAAAAVAMILLRLDCCFFSPSTRACAVAIPAAYTLLDAVVPAEPPAAMSCFSRSLICFR
jgi:hypothetical protein